MDFINLRHGDKRSSGWRKAAQVNSIILAAMSMILTSILVAVTSKNGIDKAVFFYDGDCDRDVALLNMGLHLLINIISTLVVLNSPSRQELDIAHFQGSWMGIGVSSVRNAFRVSRFKTWFWVCLLLGSIPIHLLFNSTIFQADRRDSDYHVTIATEKFINSGTYYAPGAGLVQAGFEFWLGYDNLTESQYFNSNENVVLATYGAPVNLTDYADTSSDVIKNISATALAASAWEKLDISSCKQEYIACSGLKKHRDVILVVDKPDGWKREDMWHLTDNQTEFWDRYVPANEPNHLFYDTQCVMYAQRGFEEPTRCQNNCRAAFGVSLFVYFYSVGEFLALPDWQFPFFDEIGLDLTNGSEPWKHKYIATSGLQPGTFNLTVKYCLAEPLDRICHIGLSPKLLLAVTICVVFKTCNAVTVTIVLSRRNQSPLVTLGDVIESFLEKPDPVTDGLSTIGQDQIRRAMLRNKAFLIPRPRQWQSLRKRRGSVIPKSVWLTSYLLLISSIALCGYFFNRIISQNLLFGSFFESEQNAFIDIPFSFVGGVLLANSPQLLLSFCYLTYNNLFTRLQMARECSVYSEGHHPLRVTESKGDQYSTYRLQLPYKYSIPLMIISIFLHWLLSNTIYLFVSTGGYFGTDSFFTDGQQVDSSLPTNTAIAVGYSGYSLLGLMIISCVLIVVPFFLSWKRLPSNMVNIGSNSLALSAACHASILSYAVKGSMNSPMLESLVTSKSDLPETQQPLQPPKQSYTPLTNGDYDETIGGESPASMSTLNHQSSHMSLASIHLLRDCSSENGNSDHNNTKYEVSDEQNSPFTKLARSKIRWGVVKMPPEWHAEHDNEAGRVEHLSFGVEEDDVRPPEPGECYA
ncbi:hypothetical protein F4806DRAFT_508490 [Annulohypoxylon nitens]|nr:hypothetical protein F4806DRAFT_508490 [Annulohypoxylon nitens]